MAIPLPFSRDAPALVGREREQRLLREMFATTCEGRGGLALISGEAGIGKTALAESLCREATEDGAVILIGRCFDLAETPAYGPWRYLFDRYHPDALLPPPPAAFATRGVIGDVTNQTMLFQQVRDFLTALTALRRVILLLDDFHWADPASLELLRFLAQSVAIMPLLIIVTYRSETLTRDHRLSPLVPVLVREGNAERLDLRPLDTDAVRLLIAERYTLREADTARLVAYLDARAEGNPFFLSELVRSLEETHVLRYQSGKWALGDLSRSAIPLLLRQVIDARCARFDAASQRILTIAAVIGHEVPLAVWATVGECAEETVLGVAERGLDAHLLIEMPDGTRVQFAHALVREALYASIPAIRRRQIHLHAGEALAAIRDPDPDTVAYHFQRAGDNRALPWLIQAGERAQGAFAWPTAVARYEAVLAIRGDGAIDDRTRGWLLYRITRLLRHTARERGFEYIADAQHIAEATGDCALQVATRFAHGQLLCREDRGAEGLLQVQAAVEALDMLSSDEVAQIDRQEVTSTVADFRGFLICTYGWLGRHADVRTIVERAPMTAAPLGKVPGAMGADPWWAIATDGYAGVAIMHAHEGRPAEARAALARSLALARDGFEGDARCAYAYRLWFVLVPYETDAVMERQAVTEAAEALGRRGTDILSAYLPGETGALHTDLLTGRWSEAATVLSPLIARADSYSRHACEVYGNLKRLQGNGAEAWEQVRRALPAGTMTAPGSETYEPALKVQRLAAALALDVGDLTTAKEWLDIHDRWLGWNGAVLGRSEAQTLWGIYYHVLGDGRQAREHAAQALIHATEPRQPLALLAAHRLLGELDTTAHQFGDAQYHLNASLALAEACAAPYERALTIFTIAKLRAATKNTMEARTLCDEARAIFLSLGAKPALARLDTLMAQTVDVIPTARYPAGLTLREIEVLRLVAAGHTNRQIADTLFLTEKTVKNHMTHILTKIDASNRTAAVGFALRHGLA